MKEKNYIFQISDIYLLLLPQLTILHKKTHIWSVRSTCPSVLKNRVLNGKKNELTFRKKSMHTCPYYYKLTIIDGKKYMLQKTYLPSVVTNWLSVRRNR